MGFLEYLKVVAHKVNFIKPGQAVRVVMGNESCDLDSMVSALALAYYYSTLQQFRHALVIPMMNKSKELFPIRVENIYILNKYDIPVDLLIFRDTVHLGTLQRQCNLSVTLVDFHVLDEGDKFLKTSVAEVIDHRPVDNSEPWDDLVIKDIELVGSCCSLVARRIHINKDMPQVLAGLLYDAITFDNIAYKVEAGKVKPLDLQIAQLLEMILDLPQNSAAQRALVFNELWAAHRDISHLTSEQLLYKDLKTIRAIYIPGLPILVKQYLLRDDATRAISNFYTSNNAQVVLLMGLDAEKDKVERDLAVYTKNDAVAKKLDGILTLKFEVAQDASHIPFLLYYRQLNNTLSRKHLIPIVKTCEFNLS